MILSLLFGLSKLHPTDMKANNILIVRSGNKIREFLDFYDTLRLGVSGLHAAQFTSFFSLLESDTIVCVNVFISCGRCCGCSEPFATVRK